MLDTEELQDHKYKISEKITFSICFDEQIEVYIIFLSSSK